MKTMAPWSPQRLFTSISLLVLLALLLAACGGSSNGPNGTTPTPHGTTTNVGPSGTATPATTPVIGLGSQPCPAAVKDPAHWDAIIPTQSGVSKVEAVACGNLIGTPTVQALVSVRYSATGAALDVYVYNNITSPNPTQLFKLQNLYKGDAAISLRNTVMTAEVDQNSSINKGKANANLTQDLFREFTTASFTPTSFPGIFPDLTRFQAERDQVQVNMGQDGWKLSPTMVATHFASEPALLNWPNVIATVMSGGGSSDADAVVSVKNTDTGGGTLTLTMQRLEGNTNGGIWEIITVAASGLSITAPKNRDILTSPVTVSGTGNAFEGKIGTVKVLDHTYTDIGHAGATGATGNGNTTFSVSVPYTSTFKTGMQEGIVVLYQTNNAGSTFTAAIMVKELL